MHRVTFSFLSSLQQAERSQPMGEELLKSTFLAVQPWLSAAECEEIGHRGRATSSRHVISLWLLLIEDVSAAEWEMTQEPSCSATDGPHTHTHTYIYTIHTFLSALTKDNTMRRPSHREEQQQEA